MVVVQNLYSTLLLSWLTEVLVSKAIFATATFLVITAVDTENVIQCYW